MTDVLALRFFTSDPLDHCARALDVVRRMGFELVSVSASPAPSATFLIRVNFVPVGDRPPHILASRISGFIGVTEVEIGAT